MESWCAATYCVHISFASSSYVMLIYFFNSLHFRLIYQHKSGLYMYIYLHSPLFSTSCFHHIVIMNFNVYLKELVLMHSFAFQRKYCLNQLREHLCRKGIQTQYIMSTELKYSYFLRLSGIMGWFQIVFIQRDQIWVTNKWVCNASWIFMPSICRARSTVFCPVTDMALCICLVRFLK